MLQKTYNHGTLNRRNSYRQRIKTYTPLKLHGDTMRWWLLHLFPGGPAIKSHRGQLCRPFGSALTLSNDDHSDDDDSMIDNDDDENNVDHCEDDDERGREGNNNIRWDSFLRKGQPGSTTSWTSPTGCQSTCHRKRARPENHRRIINRLV